MNTPDDPDLQAMRGANYDEWFLRELNKGIAAADRGKFLEHLDVRKPVDERTPIDSRHGCSSPRRDHFVVALSVGGLTIH
jgi:hypothetical protein